MTARRQSVRPGLIASLDAWRHAVPPELRFVIDVGSLTIGFALVLWGLRIFKAYVAIVGLLVGAGLGGAIGSVAIDADNGLLIGALVGALLGALAAWPLQRVIAFVMAGVATGLVAALLTAGPPGSDTFGLAFAIGFLVGGGLGLVVFERIVIAALAFTGAQAIFLAAFVPNEVYSTNTFTGIAEGVLDVYESRLAAFAITTLTCIGLGLWHQRSGSRQPMEPRAKRLRRAPVAFAILLLAANLAVGFGTFAFGWDTSSFALTGLHPLAWAFVSMTTVMFLGVRSRLVANLLEPNLEAAAPRRSRHNVSYPAFVLFAIGVVPLATALVFRAAGSPTWGLGTYYGAFLGPAAPALALKWFIALAWLPFVLWRAMPKLAEEASADAAQVDGDTARDATDSTSGTPEDDAIPAAGPAPIPAAADAVA
jgi:hypothetical protein